MYQIFKSDHPHLKLQHESASILSTFEALKSLNEVQCLDRDEGDDHKIPKKVL